MSDDRSASRSKIVRLIDEYGLEEIGDELEERWTRSEDRYGLRQLANYFNRQLLRAALSADNAEPLDGEIENTYRLLTDEEVTSGVRTQARNRLKQDGVDVSRLEQDFVSRQAIHTYLSNYREVVLPEECTTPAEQRDRRLETIQRLRQRLAVVAERALRSLVNSDELSLGEFNVLVNVSVYCSDCGTQFPITELLSEGACDCS